MDKNIVYILCVSLSGTGMQNIQNLESFVLKPENLENMRAKGLTRLIAYTRLRKVHRVRKRLYPFFLFFFLGAQCVESGVSCTDCY